MKKVKLLSLSLIATLICSLVPGVAASKYTTSSENKEYDSVASDSNSSCDVYVEIGSNFRVTIPKEIVLDGATKEGTYLVCVEGDIAGMEAVKVIPEDTVKLYSVDKAEVIGNISQDKTKWFCDEILDDNIVIGKGTIEADAITAGSWNGSFNFNISINEVSPLMLSTNAVTLGAASSTQVNAYYIKENVSNLVTWTSDNENITVSNGLIQTSENVKAGDTATITVTTTESSVMPMANGEELPELIATITVMISDINFLENNKEIEIIELEAGTSTEIEAQVIPEHTETITWAEQTENGIVLTKNGNKCLIKISKDTPVGTIFDVTAQYKEFEKTLKVVVIHKHSYEIENETETYIAYKCTGCEDTYTQTKEVSNNSNIVEE